MAFRQDPRFPGPSVAEMERRCRRVWEAMEQAGLDGLLVYGDSGAQGANCANVLYLAGYQDPLFAYVLVAKGREPVLFISNELYLPHARAMARVDQVDWLSWNPADRLARAVEEHGLAEGRIGLVGSRGIQRSSLPHEHVRGLMERLPRVRWQDATELLQKLRRVKSPEELELLRQGARITDATVAALASHTRPGMTECQLAGLVHRAAWEHGGEPRLTFLGSTSMEDPDLVFPRQQPSLRQLKRGDIVLTELSASYGGYPGQIHRPVAVGGAPTAQYRALFELAVETFQAVVESLQPGGTDEDVRRAARQVLAGRGVWTMDALVHGWGLSLEPPRLDVPELATIRRPQEPIVFEPGMVLVVQPHLLSADRRRGLQVGSAVAVTEAGPQVLQQYPMEFVCVG